jgi:hypothetical protein
MKYSYQMQIINIHNKGNLLNIYSRYHGVMPKCNCNALHFVKFLDWISTLIERLFLVTQTNYHLGVYIAPAFAVLLFHLIII